MLSLVTCHSNHHHHIEPRIYLILLEHLSGSTLLADSAYTDYFLEEILADNGVRLSGSKRKSPTTAYGVLT
jgi:hypothetical protein